MIEKNPHEIYGCPFCRRRFVDIPSLNQHISKKHDATKKVIVLTDGRAYVRTKS